NWHKEEKLDWLANCNDVAGIDWRAITPNDRHTWIVFDNSMEFEGYLPVGDKVSPSATKVDARAIFKMYSPGVATGRDDVVYGFNQEALAQFIEKFCDAYNAELDRYKRKGEGKNIDEFLDYSRVKWSRELKSQLRRGNIAQFDPRHIRQSMY